MHDVAFQEFAKNVFGILQSLKAREEGGNKKVKGRPEEVASTPAVSILRRFSSLQQRCTCRFGLRLLHEGISDLNYYIPDVLM